MIKGYISHGQSSYWTAKSSFLFLASDHTEADPNCTLWVDFWTMIFYNLKNSGQDLSNEMSNFILSSLEDGHWVAQTFFDKVPEITDFGLLLTISE